MSFISCGLDPKWDSQTFNVVESEYCVTPVGDLAVMDRVDCEAGEADGAAALTVGFCQQRRELALILTVFHGSGLVMNLTAGLFTVEVSRCPTHMRAHAEILAGESRSISAGELWMSSNGTTDLLRMDTDRILIC